MESVQTISRIPESQECLFFGELLVAKGLLSREELQDVLEQQREQGGRLGEVLLRLKMLSDEDVTAALRAIASKTGCSSSGDRAMMLRISDVAT